MKDIKKILTDIAAVMTLIGMAIGAVVGVMAANSMAFPTWLIVVGGSLVAVAIVITQWATGRNADLSRKTKDQLKAQTERKILGK